MFGGQIYCDSSSPAVVKQHCHPVLTQNATGCVELTLVLGSLPSHTYVLAQGKCPPVLNYSFGGDFADSMCPAV